MNNVNILSFRKLAWPFVALFYNLSRLIPFRNKKIWIYGESGGKYYVDNTKYLFEYAHTQSNDGIKHIWITDNSHILNQIKAKGFEGYKQGTLKAIWYQLRCGVAIYNKGLDDISRLPLYGGSYIVSVWHGAGFKRTYNATYTGKYLFVKKFIDHIFSWVKMNLLTATSEYQCKQFLERFNMSRNQMVITGQPRNDYFTNMKGQDSDIKTKLSIPVEKKIILYMPTYRTSFQGSNIEAKIINEILSNSQFCNYLDKTSSIFVIKLHPLTHAFGIPKDNRFRLLTHGDEVDTQHLLSIADVLITDYSSCFVDYALLHRPIIFFIPDKNDYIKYAGGMDKEFYELLEYGCAYNIEELVETLKKPSLKIAEEANNLFYDTKTGNNFSKNVYNAIVSKVL